MDRPLTTVGKYHSQPSELMLVTPQFKGLRQEDGKLEAKTWLYIKILPQKACLSTPVWEDKETRMVVGHWSTPLLELA